jgi:transcriptional regulator with XRE-family HTH domain
MFGDEVKRLRDAKCWSQAHLAEAAGLNIRTVQRIEGGEPASNETILSLAAALDADLSSLQPEVPSPANGWPSRRRLALASVAVLPAVTFIAVNLLRSIASVSGPYDLAARIGGDLMSFKTFNLVSPVIFLGGVAAALVLCAPALMRLLTTRASRGVLSIQGLELKIDAAAMAVAAAALTTGGRSDRLCSLGVHPHAIGLPTRRLTASDPRIGDYWGRIGPINSVQRHCNATPFGLASGASAGLVRRLCRISFRATVHRDHGQEQPSCPWQRHKSQRAA